MDPLSSSLSGLMSFAGQFCLCIWAKPLVMPYPTLLQRSRGLLHQPLRSFWQLLDASRSTSDMAFQLAAWKLACTTHVRYVLQATGSADHGKLPACCATRYTRHAGLGRWQLEVSYKLDFCEAPYASDTSSPRSIIGFLALIVPDVEGSIL